MVLKVGSVMYVSRAGSLIYLFIHLFLHEGGGRYYYLVLSYHSSKPI